jgi:hypothetical protein
MECSHLVCVWITQGQQPDLAMIHAVEYKGFTKLCVAFTKDTYPGTLQLFAQVLAVTFGKSFN